MRKRQEIQKMLWRVVLVLAASLGYAAVLPDNFGSWTRGGNPVTVPPPDPKVWDEYGFLRAESAYYTAGSRKLDVTIHQMKDSTGGLAAMQALRGDPGHLVQIGNYVLRFSSPPARGDLEALRKALPNVDRASLPSLPGYLPSKGKIPASERYILGPDSLMQVMPEIPPSAARFDLGSEAQFARYKAAVGGEDRLLVFSYPTPQIARLQADVFAKLPGIAARRAGPLVAVAPVRDGVDVLLQSVSYNPSLMWNEQPPKPQGNPGDMLLAIVILAGVLIAASILFGLAFGGVRIIGSRFGIQTADRGLTTLHLSDR